MIPTKQEFVAAFIKNRYAPPTDAQYERIHKWDKARELYQQAGSRHVPCPTPA